MEPSVKKFDPLGNKAQGTSFESLKVGVGIPIHTPFDHIASGVQQSQETEAEPVTKAFGLYASAQVNCLGGGQNSMISLKKMGQAHHLVLSRLSLSGFFGKNTRCT